MTQKLSELDLLDHTLNTLEQLVIGTNDKDVLSLVPRGTRNLDDIKELIARKLEEHGMQQSAVAKRSLRPSARKNQFHGLASRLEFLRRLSEKRPELSRELSAVFDSTSATTSDQIDTLIEDLIRRGVLSGNDSGDK